MDYKIEITKYTWLILSLYAHLSTRPMCICAVYVLYVVLYSNFVQFQLTLSMIERQLFLHLRYLALYIFCDELLFNICQTWPHLFQKTSFISNSFLAWTKTTCAVLLFLILGKLKFVFYWLICFSLKTF